MKLRVSRDNSRSDF